MVQQSGRQWDCRKISSQTGKTVTLGHAVDRLSWSEEIKYNHIPKRMLLRWCCQRELMSGRILFSSLRGYMRIFSTLVWIELSPPRQENSFMVFRGWMCLTVMFPEVPQKSLCHRRSWVCGELQTWHNRGWFNTCKHGRSIQSPGLQGRRRKLVAPNHYWSKSKLWTQSPAPTLS